MEVKSRTFRSVELVQVNSPLLTWLVSKFNFSVGVKFCFFDFCSGIQRQQPVGLGWSRHSSGAVGRCYGSGSTPMAQTCGSCQRCSICWSLSSRGWIGAPFQPPPPLCRCRWHASRLGCACTHTISHTGSILHILRLVSVLTFLIPISRLRRLCMKRKIASIVLLFVVGKSLLVQWIDVFVSTTYGKVGPTIQLKWSHQASLLHISAKSNLVLNCNLIHWPHGFDTQATDKESIPLQQLEIPCSIVTAMDGSLADKAPSDDDMSCANSWGWNSLLFFPLWNFPIIWNSALLMIELWLMSVVRYCQLLKPNWNWLGGGGRGGGWVTRWQTSPSGSALKIESRWWVLKMCYAGGESL